MFGHWEIIVLAVLALALFGGGMLPKIARTAGRTLREVKSVKDDVLSLEADVEGTDAHARKAQALSDSPDQKPPANKPTSAP